MPLTHRVNLIDHDRWVSSGYNRSFSWGLVRDKAGKELGFWRVARYNPNLDTEGGCYEFSLTKTGPALVSKELPLLESEVIRGVALSEFLAGILKWDESKKR